MFVGFSEFIADAYSDSLISSVKEELPISEFAALFSMT